jgi:AcrR family transcriptional regulator
MVARPGAAPDRYVDRILDAALDQLAATGIRRTTVDDVAHRAGVSRITVYRRFPNRDALLLAVALREGGRLLAQLDDVLDGAGGPEGPDLADAVVVGFVVALRFARTHPVLQRLLATEPDEALRLLTIDAGPLLAVARGYLAGHLRAAQRGGRFRGLDPEEAAELVVRLCQSFVLTPAGVLDLGDDRRARRFAERWLRPAIAAAERPAPRRTRS